MPTICTKRLLKNGDIISLNSSKKRSIKKIDFMNEKQNEGAEDKMQSTKSFIT